MFLLSIGILLKSGEDGSVKEYNVHKKFDALQHWNYDTMQVESEKLKKSFEWINLTQKVRMLNFN